MVSGALLDFLGYQMRIGNSWDNPTPASDLRSHPVYALYAALRTVQLSVENCHRTKRGRTEFELIHEVL